MKKFFGKKEFSETLYYYYSSEIKGLPDEFYREGYETGIVPQSEYENEFDDSKNEFIDTNLFIRYTENFNVFQSGKI